MQNSPLIINSSDSGTTAYFNHWSYPEQIDIIEKEDSLEIIYKETSLMSNYTGSPNQRVFKIVYSCVDGKWNKSDKIYGKIIPASQEYYEF